LRHTTVQAMQASSIAMYRVRVCLDPRAPGLLAFHHVRQVRGTMLLLDMAAALVSQQPRFLQLLREDHDARGMLETGVQSGCCVLRLDRRRRRQEMHCQAAVACTRAAGVPACLLCMGYCVQARFCW
jgi:hypothetical protein